MTDATETRTPDSRPTGGLSAQYQPGEVEQRRYETWVSAGYFTADPTSDKPPFSIVIPPPNVTGSLHIGHALDHTIQDTLTRLKRMQGFEVLWLPGMDHAGIATQNVVERQLAAQQLSRHDLGREEFVEQGLGVEGRVRRRDPRADAPARRLGGLVARAVHDGRGPVPGGPDDLQAAVRRRADLPGQPDHQLVPALPDRAQ